MEKEIYEKLMSKFEGLDPSLLEMLSQHLMETNTDENGNQVKEIDELVEEMTISRVITLATEKEVSERLAKESVSLSSSENNESALPDWALEIIETQNQIKVELEDMICTINEGKRGRAVEKLICKLPDAVKLPYAKIKLDRLSEEEFTALYNEIKEEVAKYLTTDLQSNMSYAIPYSNEKNSYATPKDIDEVVKQLYI